MTTIKIRINRRIHTDTLRNVLSEKLKSNEERRYDGEKVIVKITYEEPDAKEWGGARPCVTLEYDERNRFL
eukprot:CAMPEP_0197451504 /NCGR_PEP_ID=MMETSP1175-20131217/29116_1 /TAXON_ID=1003142 /ORGANISM="Triceratium dubium, Strain CCMP147" /LENGTH=70 /DNA_ID=CAMNT_0042984239 /DNA_START=3 /DNA_END=211 /DNA_ORIENTATION=+